MTGRKKGEKHNLGGHYVAFIQRCESRGGLTQEVDRGGRRDGEKGLGHLGNLCADLAPNLESLS